VYGATIAPSGIVADEGGELYAMSAPQMPEEDPDEVYETFSHNPEYSKDFENAEYSSKYANTSN
jgi:hypothetical protein